MCIIKETKLTHAHLKIPTLEIDLHPCSLRMIFALRTLCYEILDSVGGLPLSVLEKPSNWEWEISNLYR